ncbi:MAG: IS110 family transposase [Candidatus Aminicenantes bacterium]|nr:IS110 family transposase [Candidatus Aminicenantes bacterium]
MIKQDLEESNGGRTVIGIDPCSQFLQLAILTPNKKTEFKKLPLSPSITEEIARSTDPATTQIAIESYGSYGKLFVYDLLKRGYDIREVNPHISKKMAGLFNEEHSDQKDAESLAKALQLIPDLPRISITDKKQWLAKLTRTRKKLVKDLNGYLNRLHIALTESYGVVYKSLFKTLFTKKALMFFEDKPTINDSVSDEETKERLGQEKWDLLIQAGKWKDDYYLETLRTEIRGLIGIIRSVNTTKIALEKNIKEIAEQVDEMRILQTFPGIGGIAGATLLSEIGDIERFDRESYLSAYCGVSPVIWQSGTGRIRTKRRKRYSRRLKGILYFIALSQIRINPESRAYYDRKRKEGKTHWQAMNALSRQLIKIIYYMLKNMEPYRRPVLVN